MSARTNWTDKAHFDLLQAVMTESPPTMDSWDRIIPRLRAQGYNYTATAAL